MKKRSTRTKLIAAALGLVAFAAILTTWEARRVDALAEDHNLFVVGLSSGQTARLSVLNSGEKRGYVINWKFLDGQGRVLSQAPERVFIPTTQMRSFDLNADDLISPRDRFGRIHVLAVVSTLGGPDTKNLHASLEVFDNATGRTTVIFPTETIKGFNPQPDQPGIQQ